MTSTGKTLEPEKRYTDRLIIRMATTLTGFTQTEELEDGYGFQCDWDKKHLVQTVELLGELREVLPSIRTEIILEPNGGPVLLRIHGGVAVKETVGAALRQRPVR